MKCPKCRKTMNNIRTVRGIYWHCNNCNTDVGKSTETINDAIEEPIEPTIAQEVNDEKRETRSNQE